MKSSLNKAIAYTLVLLTAIIASQSIFGQMDTVKSQNEKRYLKNSIKMNVTNPMIFGTSCLVAGYERTIGDHQSFEVNAGSFSLPKLININTDSIKELSKGSSSRGLHISGEYRFYLAKENKYKSPHGVYIGPYVTYNSYTRYMDMTANTPSFTGDLNAKIGFYVSTVGFQLGYQFIFWNRVSLDMVLFGPGIAAYKLKTELSTTLDPDQESELFKKINDALSSKIPGYDLVISPGTYERTGTMKTTNMGFRYVIMLGIRF